MAGLVAEGLTNREIAERLFISERTADGHLEHIREKLGVNNRAQVAAWFVVQSTPGTAVPTVSTGRPGIARSAWIATVLAGSLVVAVTIAVAGGGLLTADGPLIVTVAGSTDQVLHPGGGYTGDSGQASNAQFSRPTDIATDVGTDGMNLYIADSDNGAVRRIDPDRTIRTLAGGVSAPLIVTLAGGGFPAPLIEGGNASSTWIGSVWGVAVSPQRAVYFSNGHLIATVTRNLRLHQIPSGPISQPAGLTFGADGSLYIADYGADRVWLRTPDGTISPYAGSGSHGVKGDNGSALAAELKYPNRLALDRAGNLFIADEGNNRIRRVDHQSGIITTVAGSSPTYGFSGDGGPARNAKLSLPEGVAVSADGDVYIADTGNNRVRRVDARTQMITTIAGTGEPGFGGDGRPAMQARLYGPVALALTVSGDLYIVDMGNNRVRLIRRVGRG